MKEQTTQFRFDKTLTLGHILTLFALFCSALGIYLGIRIELHSINLRMQMVERQIEQLPALLQQTIRHDEQNIQIRNRIDQLNERIKNLEAMQRKP